MATGPPLFLGCLVHHSSQLYFALKLKGEIALTLRVFLILLVTKILSKNANYCVSFIAEFIILNGKLFMWKNTRLFELLYC